jgi:cysteine synthase A
MLYDDVTQLIGRTPTVRINRIGPKNVTLYGKLEAMNPGGSVKDRIAIGILDEAARRGELKPGQTVVESTAGNTGIALAMVCATRGHPFVAVMPDSFSPERATLMRAYGAKVILTPHAEKSSGAVALANKLAKENDWFMAGQFEREENPAIHRQTTAAEIIQDFAGRRLDYFVVGWGTGGTLAGVSKVLRAARPDTKIITCQPENAQLLSGKEWGPHKIEGWTPDFIAKIFDREAYDQVLPVTDDEAINAARELTSKEGIFCGISSGAAFAVALKVAKDAPEGSVILALLPDSGSRYLSTALLDHARAPSA